MYDYFLEELRKCYNEKKVFGGAFQQYMNVALVNDGPVTIEIEEKNQKLEK